MTRACRERTHSAGYSLVEMMVVVVITGILAAIAIPTFTGYIMKSRASEATQFLGVIKLREESYRSEFGRYACTTASSCPMASSGSLPFASSDFNPGDASAMNGRQLAFNSVASWNQLGAKPDGPVRFGYAVAAGLPGALPSDVDGFSGDHWFVAQAVADLDNDGTAVTFEIYSESKGVWVSQTKGWE